MPVLSRGRELDSAQSANAANEFEARTADGAHAGAKAVTPSKALHLTHPEALNRFFANLASLDDRSASRDVRIAYFGDSHTAADYETGPLRRSLQARFGNGGRGFVALGSPWKNYVQESIRNVSSSSWTTSKSRVSDGNALGDGMFGLSGTSMSTSTSGATLSTDVLTEISEFEIAYLERPGGGAFDVLVDDHRVARIETRPPPSSESGASGTAHTQFRKFSVVLGKHSIQARVRGDGPVRIHGVALGNSRNGLVLSALGINGARVSSPLGWNEITFAEDLRHEDPHLVVLAYGTNEASDDTSGAFASVYEKQLVDTLGRMARAVPAAACLLVGPPDRAVSQRGSWSTPQALLAVEGVQRRVAEAAGCAFYSQLDAMGGPGSMARWASESPARGGSDRVHLSKLGYASLANSISSALTTAYDEWRADEGLAPVFVTPAALEARPASRTKPSKRATAPAPHASSPKAKRPSGR